MINSVSQKSLTAPFKDLSFKEIFLFGRYNSTVTKKCTWIIAAVCWILASILSFLPMFGWYNHDTLAHYNSTSIDCQFIAVIPDSYLVHLIYECCFLPLLAVMITLYGYIFLKKRQSRGRAGVAAETGEYNQREQKLARSLVLILALFVVCWLPLHLIQAITYYSITRIYMYRL